MVNSSERGTWNLSIGLLCNICLPIVSLHFLIKNLYVGVEERLVINTGYDFAYDTP